MNDKGNNPSMQNRDNHSTLNKRKKTPECLRTKEINIMNNKGINLIN